MTAHASPLDQNCPFPHLLYTCFGNSWEEEETKFMQNRKYFYLMFRCFFVTYFIDTIKIQKKANLGYCQRHSLNLKMPASIYQNVSGRVGADYTKVNATSTKARLAPSSCTHVYALPSTVLQRFLRNIRTENTNYRINKYNSKFKLLVLNYPLYL